MSVRGLSAMLVIAAGCGDNHGGFDVGVDLACTEGATWSAMAPMPNGGVQETAAVALDGKVYVLGGFNAAVEIVDQVFIYDTATDTWSEGPHFPRPIHHPNAAVADGTIYVLGGLEGPLFDAFGDVFAWNPSTDAAWTTRTTMPTGSERGAAVAGAIGDVIYVAGGQHAATLPTLSAYSTTTDSWDTNLPPLPVPSEHACGGVIDGKLYVVSGRYQGNSPLVFEYTPGGDWHEKARITTPRSGIACGICGHEIIVAGGELNPATATAVYSEVEALDVTTNVWTSLPPMMTPRHGMQGAVVDRAFYIPGGATKTQFEAVPANEVLRR